MSPRKLWATMMPGAAFKRHESKAAVYRYVDAQVANWRCGALRSPSLQVWLDERDGRGFKLYERLNLEEM